MKFTLKDKLLYALGCIAFLLGGPIVMLYLNSIYYMTFLPVENLTFYLGGFSSAVGLVFAFWANYELLVKGEGGAANFGSVKLMPETKHLVTTGPYSICRNPMHLGVFLYFMGFTCAVNSIICLLVPLAFAIFAYLFAIFLDEPRLARDFPDEWEVYRNKVPRFMPRILKRNP